MQVPVSINNIKTLLLMDSGAADQNLISAQFCTENGIAIFPIANPFEVTGIAGTGTVTHGCKATLRFASFSCQAVFNVVTMPYGTTFQAIMGDGWLDERKTTLSYEDKHCVVYHCGRKHELPLACMPVTVVHSQPSQAAVVDATTAATYPRDNTSTATAPLPSYVIGYAQAKRMLKQGEVWHSMVVVRPRKPEVPTSVAAVSVPTAPGTTAPAGDTPSELLAEAEVQRIVSSYPEVFTDAPPYGGSQVQLDFEVNPLEAGTQPVLRPMFRYSPFEMEEMQRLIEQLIAQRYQTLYISVWCSCAVCQEASQYRIAYGGRLSCPQPPNQT
jgi:hypothetical protein